MRRYDDPVDVQRGRVQGVEGPEGFRWRDRDWQVREVVGHWVETGAWWRGQGGDQRGDLLAERELWRVVAGRGRGTTPGVFDLAFSWTDGGWRLAGCLD